ncbi:serine/threonine-protein phosphatase PPG1 [Nematocida minor]|uniref:serine/threonine-protein phosphatase PPG1 n=1 Tax=Nematocida minor TaxID=1912983 RepID=UPI002220681C|nr:serine/threonine-protein phosphatase PPG1 [Nematocida minor]KAI5192416.1 serine/threonine-protein phosphatase PPG1 [Nematocida minor]
MTKPCSLADFLTDESEFVQKLSAGQLTNKEIFEICEEATEIFASEPFMLSLSSEIVVIGDIHGQYFDLLNILKLSPSSKYLFLGDFVDRGANSVETIILLFYMKIKYSDSVWLLRGNHESLRTSSCYGFQDECMRMYGSKLVWYRICSVFDFLPICGIIDSQIFAVHAGIGPNLDITKFEATQRVGDVPSGGDIANLLWSDPDPLVDSFVESKRGIGYYFGEKQVDEFLRKTGLKKIIRSHQLVDEGYKEDFNGKVITIWSAPNYCYRCMNKAAVARIRGETIEYCEIPVAEFQRKETKPLSYFL